MILNKSLMTTCKEFLKTKRLQAMKFTTEKLTNWRQKPTT